MGWDFADKLKPQSIQYEPEAQAIHLHRRNHDANAILVAHRRLRRANLAAIIAKALGLVAIPGQRRWSSTNGSGDALSQTVNRDFHRDPAVHARDLRARTAVVNRARANRRRARRAGRAESAAERDARLLPVGAPSLLGLPPAPPGAPAAFATPAAIPQLNPAPAAPLASLEVGAPTPRVFSCSCGGPGFPTQWVGNVSSTTFLSWPRRRPAARAPRTRPTLMRRRRTSRRRRSDLRRHRQAPTSPYLVGNAIPFTSSIGLQPGATQPKRINSLLTTENCSRCACD